MYEWLSDALADDRCQVVTANRRLARTLRIAHNKRQIAAGVGAWRSPSIHAFADWLGVLASTARQKPDLPTRINGQQSHLLWEACLREDIDDPLINIGGLARQCRDAWLRMHEWLLPLAECQSAAQGQDRRIFARAAGRYAKQLGERSWIDDARSPDLLAELARDGTLRPPKQLVLVGFDRTTPQQDALVSSLSEAGTSITMVAAALPGEARLWRYENPDAELRAAGAWARAALTENPELEIAIVVNNLEQQADRCARMLREGMVPGWQYGDTEYAAALNVSYGRKLADYPTVHVALLALRWLYSDLAGAELSVLLRSPFLGGRNADGRSRLELKLRDWPDRQWSRELLLRAFATSEESADAGDWLTRWASLDEVLAEVPRRQRPARWAEFFDAILKTLNWPGEASLSSVDFQLDNRWRDLLNEFSRLELISPLMTGPEAMARLSAMAGESVFQPESEMALVSVLGPLEAAGLQFDRIWVAGLSAADWPPAGRPTPLLSRDLQRKHGLPDATPEDTAEYAVRILKRLQASATECTFSYPATIGDAEQLPTALLNWLDVSDGIPDPGWHAACLLRENGIEVVADSVPPVAERESIAGGSGTIQKQISDPFSAFAYGRLGIRWMPSFTSGIAANVRGSLIHDSLCRLYADTPSQAELKAWSDEQTMMRISAAVDQAFRRHERHADTMLRQLLALEKRRSIALLHDVVTYDRQRETFSIFSVEQEIVTTLGSLQLKLRCDRIDGLGGGPIVILDYKTGLARKFLTRGEPGDMQLVVYACAVEQEVAALGLYNVDTRAVLIDGAGPALRDVDDWPTVLSRWKKAVMHAADQIAEGDVRLNAHQGIQAARPLNLLSRFSELGRGF